MTALTPASFPPEELVPPVRKDAVLIRLERIEEKLSALHAAVEANFDLLSEIHHHTDPAVPRRKVALISEVEEASVGKEESDDSA